MSTARVAAPGVLWTRPDSWPEHSPERRQFSVLCYRGWCDNEFRDQDVAALAGFVTGQDFAVHRGRARYCPTPFTCQCECHDEWRAALGGQITAHTEAAYSKHRGFSQDHAVLDSPLAAGRFQRQAGEALCGTGRPLWGSSPRGDGRVDCPECLSRAERYGVVLP